MIKVEHLTKRYAGHTAIRDLNFEVGQGEIMGFLGPNGAGKTTTMRILAGFMPATSGRASIAGFDVFKHSLQARSRLGYMLENVRSIMICASLSIWIIALHSTAFPIVAWPTALATGKSCPAWPRSNED